MNKIERIAARYIHRKTAGYPTSLGEWEAYIKTLVGENLFSKAVAINTQRCADILKEDGFSMADFQKIVVMFVRQCAATDTRIPIGGAYNMVTMARTDPIARRGVTVSPEDVERMKLIKTVKPEDDIDKALSTFETEDEDDQ